MKAIKVAAIQISPGEDMDANVNRAMELVRAAAKEGARFIALPEYFFYYGAEERWAEAAGMSPLVLAALTNLARELGVYILAGTMLIPSGMEGKFFNSSTLIGPEGQSLLRYAKRHLFDVRLDSGEFCESGWLVPGTDIAAAEVDGWMLGMAICFDLRFSEHFMKLMDRACHAIAVPSAFSQETGSAHWMTLIRARAIETQCYVIAPALWGDCGRGKTCFGSSAIIGPWGDAAAVKETGEGYASAILDPAQVERARRKIPMRRV